MKKIEFSRVGFNITYRCTLKCKLCLTFTPYWPHPAPHYPYEEIKRQIEHFFDIAETVGIISITGGEPLLHPDLLKIIDLIGVYRDRIGRIDLVTNGTMVPSKELARMLKKLDCRVILDDYGESLSTKVEKAEEVLRAENVNYQIRDETYYGGWVDLLHYLEEPRTEEEARELFARCKQANEMRCNPVINGKIYVCGPCEFYTREGAVSEDPAYYIDLLEEPWDADAQRKKALDFLRLDYMAACKRCKGFCADSERHRPAEQLK